MGKSKIPKDRIGRGLAAYQKTMTPAHQKDSVREEAKAAEGLIRTAGSKQGAGQIPKKTGLTLPSGEGASKEEASKYRRVAQFLILIGNKEAPAILAKLDKAQVEEVSKEIASIKGITAGEVDAVLYEFRDLVATSSGYTGSAEGGVEAARRILHAAYGPEKGEALLRKTVPGAAGNPFDFLEDFSGEHTALLLRDESPASIALVLSRLSPRKSAETLTHIPGGKKTDIVMRIARLGETSPEVLERAAEALREKALSAAAPRETSAIDGRHALTAILKHADLDFGDRILSELEDEDPELGRDLKERFHTLEDIVFAEDRPLQEKLRSMEDREIALLLKGKSGEFIEKIYSNLSSSRRAIVREEDEILGAAPKRDVDAVTGDFLVWFRLGREEGRIVLMNDDDMRVVR